MTGPKLGKSYYRSPEYERERQILREHGFIVSPISQFGIGFLSCFMLADEIRLRTRPGQVNDDARAAYDVRLSGSGSLFWLSPGTLERQGTEITLYLKQPFQLDHDRERAILWLKRHFKYLEQHDETEKEWEAFEQQKRIDPMWITGRYVIWPLFPILLHPADHVGQAVCLDDRFHGDVLAPIAIEAVIKKAAEWDFPASALGQPRWEYLDWEDNQGDQATGTRIQLMFPYHLPAGDPPLPLDPPMGSSLMQAHELAAFVETTLDGKKTRELLTVKGIVVGNLDVCARMLPASAGIGARLWVDLRGIAAPRLTADRKTALSRDDINDWPNLFESVFQRWCGWLQDLLHRYPLQLASGLLSASSVRSDLRPKIPATPQLSRWQLKKGNDNSVEWTGRWLTALLNQEIIRDRDFTHALDFGLDFDHTLNVLLNLFRNLDLKRVRDFNRDRIRTIDHDLGFDFDFVLAAALALSHTPDFTHTFTPTFDLIVDFIGSHVHARDFTLIPSHIGWKSLLTLYLLPEAFADDLSRSFPALGVCGLKGQAGNGWLVAPGWIEWDVDPATTEVRRESPKQQWSRPLIDKSYDLVFPLTHVPLGRLRRDCPEWRSDRSYRALGVLAYFLLGSEEWFKKQNQEFLDLFKVSHIHALMPNPELWLKPFDDWTEIDWNTCGLSALWDIESGVVYWAEGAHKADDMKRIGKPIKQFIGSKKK